MDCLKRDKRGRFSKQKLGCRRKRKGTSTELAVAPILKMAGPEPERNEESSYIFISTPTELGKVKGLQTQEVSDLTEGYLEEGLPEESDEKKLSFSDTISHTVDISEGEECDENDSTDAVYEPSFALSEGEPEKLQTDCETVHKDNSHEDTEISKAKCFLTPSATGNNGHMCSDHILSIHGLPVNQPFSLKYPSPSTGNMIESKVYVIVEQRLVPSLNATPIKIDVKGHVRQISLGSNNLNISKNEKEINDSADTDHLTQSLESFQPHSNSPGGIHVIGKEREGFENVTIKTEWDEEEKNRIMSDIMNDVNERVVSEGNIPRNHEYNNSKRKTRHQTMCKITKKQRLLKYEDDTGSDLPHSSRSHSRGYRINYADLDKSGGFRDVSDLEDIFSDLDESDYEDPDFYEEKKVAEKLQKRRKEEFKRIKVFLKDHPDKYYTKDQVSIERKFRGLKETDKTFKLFVCALCKQFHTSNTVLLETHIEHHLNGDWNCKKCNFEGHTLHEYRLHMNESHPSGKRCPVCKKECGCKKQLQEHLVTVHNLLPFVCARCSTDNSYVMFKENSEYYQHYRENHMDVMHQCNFCGLHFMSSYERRRHACSGKEKEKTTCDICGKEVRRKYLQRHKRSIHDNVRPYPCQLCSYASKTAKDLKFHVLAKHEGNHQFKCDFCDFTCVREYQLVSHMRTHTGEKPYKCDLCPYAAAWNVQLKEHKQLHGNPIGKECEVCGIVVRQGVSYSNHYKKHNEKERQTRENDNIIDPAVNPYQATKS